MKSNVKLPVAIDATRMRVSVLSLLGLGACSSTPDADGLVVAPMAETISSASAEVDAAAPDASSHRRVAIEPHSPGAQMACTRDVNCIAELSSPPPDPYMHPYEKCDPSPLGEVGHLSPMETNAKRKDDPTMCCYVSFNGCQRRSFNRRGGGGGRVMIGRPLRDAEGSWITSRAITSNAWRDAAWNVRAPDATRGEQAQFWANGARLEHASVAEFSRVALALLALGAPPDLIADTHRAALDEIEHAKICFELASRFAGRDVGPGALDVSRAEHDVSIASLVRDALRDGCLGESAAALELHEMARAETDVDIAGAIESMARDEERHAALAWRIVDFAMSRDAATTHAVIEDFLRTLEPRTEIEELVVRDVIRPCALALTSRATPQSPRGDDCAREA